MDKKNHIISMVVVMLVVAGVAFYGGMTYGASKSAQSQSAQGGRNGGGGFGGGQRGAGGGQGQGQGQAGANAGGFASGQITAKDDTSITVKMRDGSSKIVFYSGSTGIDKSVSGATSDLSVGQQVMVSGKSSPDGSVTAQTIQIRPAQASGSVQ